MTYASLSRIIHLDDHSLFRDGVLKYCIKPFFTNPDVIEFSNGDEAYKFIMDEIEANKKIDLIITDINHPGLKGNEFVKAVRYYENLFNSSMHIPIIILSMVEETYFPELIVNKIVDGYLPKTTEVKDIIVCMETILQLD